ncbi:MAG: rhodanese-like domain-containing protein [Gemmiger sp.]
MNFFDRFRTADIDLGVKECAALPGAVLLDVRTPEEYAEGHIPGSTNIPLQALDEIGTVVPEKTTPLFVYCRSGSRSGQAAGRLKQMGYEQVRNIGGILSYHGELER